MKFFLRLFLFVIILLNPPTGLAFNTSDPSVSLLQNRISNNFSRKYCKAIQNGFSKDEAMKSAIVKTENIIPRNRINIPKGSPGLKIFRSKAVFREISIN